MQKFIWDLDETLLSADFRKEDDFFKEQILDEKVDEFIKNKVKYLMEYERMFFKYDTKLLSEFLTLRSGLKIDEKIIEAWMEHNKNIPDTIPDPEHRYLFLSHLHFHRYTPAGFREEDRS